MSISTWRSICCLRAKLDQIITHIKCHLTRKFQLFTTIWNVHILRHGTSCGCNLFRECKLLAQSVRSVGCIDWDMSVAVFGLVSFYVDIQLPVFLSSSTWWAVNTTFFHICIYFHCCYCSFVFNSAAAAAVSTFTWHWNFNFFNASCSKLLLFEGFSAILA